VQTWETPCLPTLGLYRLWKPYIVYREPMSFLIQLHSRVEVVPGFPDFSFDAFDTPLAGYGRVPAAL